MSFLTEIQAAGLPIISVSEVDGSNPVFSVSLTEAQVNVFTDLKLSHFNSTAYNQLLADRVDIQDLKDNYSSTITTLQAQENAVNPTNAQVVTAVKHHAKVLRLLLKFLRGLLT